MSSTNKEGNLKTTLAKGIEKAKTIEPVDFIEYTEKYPSVNSVKPDDVERRDGPGGD